MKDLIKVRINDNLSHMDERVWYVNQQGCELMVKDKGEYFKLPYLKVFIPKCHCTVIQDNTEKEQPHPSRTDDLYLHIFEKHGLSLKDNHLNEIIDIAVKSDNKEEPEEWVPKVGEWATFESSLKKVTAKVVREIKVEQGYGRAFDLGENLPYCIISYLRKPLANEIPTPEPEGKLNENKNIVITISYD